MIYSRTCVWFDRRRKYCIKRGEDWNFLNSIDASGKGFENDGRVFVCVKDDDVVFEIERHKQNLSLKRFQAPIFFFFFFCVWFIRVSYSSTSPNFFSNFIMH